MFDAILGLIIAVLATSGLVLGVNFVEQSFRSSGRYNLTTNEKKILQSAGLSTQININNLNVELQSMPQKQ